MATHHIHGFIEGFSRLYTEQRELAAIWLNHPLVTGQGKAIRIAPGALVSVENGSLIDCTGEPTHKVIACFGTINSQFEMTLINILTNEPVQIKL